MRPVRLKKLLCAAIPVLVAGSALAMLANRNASSSAVSRAKQTILGTAISPANFPKSTPQDFEDFFNLAAAIGSHVTLITEWKDGMPLSDVRNVKAAARAKGLQLHLHLSPIALYGGRKDPAVPGGIGRSFTEPRVREAFRSRALELASAPR